MGLAKGAQSFVQRHPLAVDTVIAGALAVAALVSLAATYGALPANDPTYSHGFTVAVVASMLAITLPLAGRRHFPFSVGVVVVTGFLVARAVVHVPEANVTLLALWLMFYSVAVYANRRYRTPFLAVCYLAIIAELVRELFFPGPPGASPLVRVSTSCTTWSSCLCLGCLVQRFGRCGIVSELSPLRLSNFRENVRRTPVRQCSKNAFGSPVSCTMSWRTM